MRFDDYGKRLMDILDIIKNDNRKFYCAVLAFAPNCWLNTNSLFQYNMDRDNSFKRCLREHTKEGLIYGQTIKEVIDYWKKTYGNMSVTDFMDKIIAEKLEQADPWLKGILREPSCIDYACYKKIYISTGHVILAQRKTEDSHCFDPIFIYFKECCERRGYTGYKLYDSKGEYSHAFEYDGGEHKYLIRWYGDEGEYSVTIDENNSQIYSPQEMFNIIDKLINTIC